MMSTLNRFSKGVNTLEVSTVESIDKAIAHYMVDEALTQEGMAKLLSMTTNTLRWKREGKSDWTWSEILTLADLIGKTPDQLAGF